VNVTVTVAGTLTNGLKRPNGKCSRQGGAGKTPSQTKAIAGKTTAYPQGEALSATHNVSPPIASVTLSMNFDNLAFYFETKLLRLMKYSVQIFFNCTGSINCINLKSPDTRITTVRSILVLLPSVENMNDWVGSKFIPC